MNYEITSIDIQQDLANALILMFFGSLFLLCIIYALKVKFWPDMLPLTEEATMPEKVPSDKS